VQSAVPSFPYSLLMNQRFTGINATPRSESSSRSFTGRYPSSGSGAACFGAVGHPGPNKSFNGTETRALRGFHPVNSNR